MRGITKWTAGPMAFVLAFLGTETGVRMAWGEGLSGQIRATFVEASSRSCLRTAIDAPANKQIPVAVLFAYCNCYSNGMADKMSNDEVKSLEATGNEEKYAAAVHDRTVVVVKQCQEEIRKSLLKSN